MLRFLIPICLSLFLSFTALADTALNERVTERQKTIDQIARTVDTSMNVAPEVLDELRTIRDEARTAIEQISRQLSDVDSQLTAIGPSPERPGQELRDVSERRQILEARQLDLNRLFAQARLNADEADRLLAEMAERKRESFIASLIELDRSAISPTLWQSGVAEGAELATLTSSAISKWVSDQTEAGTLIASLIRLFGALAFLIVLFIPSIWGLTRILAKFVHEDGPSETARYASLVLRIAIRLIPGFIGGFTLLATAREVGLVSGGALPVANMIWFWSMAVLAAAGMAIGLVKPRNPKWRILPLTERGAKLGQRLSVLSVLAVGTNMTVETAAKLLPSDGAALVSLSNVALAIAIAVLMMFALPSKAWAQTEGEGVTVTDQAKKRWTWLRGTSVPAVVLILGALLFGYLNLARYVSIRVVLIVGLIVWLWIGRKVIMSVLQTIDSEFIEKRAGEETSVGKSMLFWAGLVIDFLILIATIPLALLVAGMDAYDVRAGMMDAFSGVMIGNFRLSLSDILAGIATFFVILLVTRFLQRTLDTRLFERSGADPGFRNSFKTLLGYTGLVIAFLAALGVVRVNLGNLAIIAGALSVGIGFGLQSIVNNFVSGLILLFERPVKVGDWVVTTSGEGFVKQISVRSTEIETFDRASIILPNSELISNAVSNWTHKDRSGRIVIPVGVSYGSDMELVRDALLQCAEDHALVLKYPKPFVYFKNFGDSSLDVELRCFVRNIPDGILTRSDLRFAILRAFRERDIEIPFPQRDLHIIPGNTGE